MTTVQDVLQRPLFRSAEVLAGHDGLHRIVHWVHVGEIPEIGQYLKGHELVLSTGVGLSTKADRRQFIDGLIVSEAAGLVVELGQYLAHIPEDMLVRANQAHFPVIVFHHPVRFLDLSREIDAWVISQHHQLLEDLASLSLQLRRSLLNTDGPRRLLELLQIHLDRPVYYRLRLSGPDPIGLAWSAPVPPIDGELAVNPTLLHRTIRQTVMVFGQAVGDVYVDIDGGAISEHLYLALDYTVAALAQDYIRQESLDRTHRREDAALLGHLMFDQPANPTLLPWFFSRYRFNPGMAFQIIATDALSLPNTMTVGHQAHESIMLSDLKRDDGHVLLLVGWPTSLDRVVDSWITRSPCPRMGISQYYRDPLTMHQALVEAQEAHLVAKIKQTPLVRYSQMGLWRWIIRTPHETLRHTLVQPELGALLLRDDSEKLIATLEALLAHQHQRKAASDSLGIHRQTLYARLHQLQEVLGHNFLESPRTLALGSALMAHQYLTAMASLDLNSTANDQGVVPVTQ